MKGTDPHATPGRNALNKPSAQQEQARKSLYLHRPPPAQSYGSLRTGPGISISYEPNVTAPVDGSNSTVRGLSPFMIQVEPPLVYGSEPAYLDGGRQPDVNVKAYGSAQAHHNTYSDARETLSASSYATADYGFATPQEYVNSRGERRKAVPGDPARTVDPKGRAGNNLGQPAISDVYTALDIAMQLSAILKTPPLVLLINPESFEIQHQKIQQYTDRTRSGFVYQAWGEEHPKLTISARCGAFISGSRGVSAASRKDSAAWQNLMAAFQFYQNNGYIYDTLGGSNAHYFVGALSIHYDQWIYYGNIDSFTWTHEESNDKGGVTFQIGFTASMITDTAQTSLAVTPMRKLNPRSGELGQGRPPGSDPLGFAGDPTFGAAEINQSPSPPRGAGNQGVLNLGGSINVPLNRSGFVPSEVPLSVSPVPVVSLSPEPFKVR